MSEHKCEGRIWGGMHFHTCGKTARYEHEGKWYCKRHHPPTEQAKRDARSKKFREEFEARQQASREAEKAHAEMQRKAAAYDGLVAQRDALKQTLHDELAVNLRLRDLGGARPDEPMLTFLERIIAERDRTKRLVEDMQAELYQRRMTGRNT